MGPVDEDHNYIYKRLADQDEELAKLEEALIKLSKALHETIKRVKILETNFAVF